MTQTTMQSQQSSVTTVQSQVQMKPQVAVQSTQNDVIRQRQIARNLALQAAYEIDCVGHAPGSVVDERIATEKPGEHTVSYLRWLIAGIVTNREQLDILISKYAPDFPIDQLAIVDRNLLRLGLFELGSKDADTPPKVVINEAVEMAKLFGSDGTARFVNGVLGAALNEVVRKVF